MACLFEKFHFDVAGPTIVGNRSAYNAYAPRHRIARSGITVVSQIFAQMAFSMVPEISPRTYRNHDDIVDSVHRTTKHKMHHLLVLIRPRIEGASLLGFHTVAARLALCRHLIAISYHATSVAPVAVS